MELKLDEWNVAGFLVKRDASKIKSAEQYLSLEKINIGEQMKTRFKEVLSAYLCDENHEFKLDLKEFKDFMSDDARHKKYKISKTGIEEESSYFNRLLSLINEEDSENELVRGKFSKYYSIILKFSKGEQEILYFRKLSRVKVGKRKFHIYEGHVEAIDKDFIFFDEIIDFIYFKKFTAEGSTDKERDRFNDEILIFDRDNFKTLFRLYEYCIQKAGEFFEKFGFIEIADIETDKKDYSGKLMKLKDSFIHDNILNEQITRIKTLYEYQISFKRIKNLKQKRGEKYKFKIKGNKIKIGDKHQMRDLIDLIDEKIASPDWDNNKILRYSSKGESL